VLAEVCVRDSVRLRLPLPIHLSNQEISLDLFKQGADPDLFKQGQSMEGITLSQSL